MRARSVLMEVPSRVSANLSSREAMAALSLRITSYEMGCRKGYEMGDGFRLHGMH